jgi:hypothetical protein
MISDLRTRESSLIKETEQLKSRLESEVREHSERVSRMASVITEIEAAFGSRRPEQVIASLLQQLDAIQEEYGSLYQEYVQLLQRS